MQVGAQTELIKSAATALARAKASARGHNKVRGRGGGATGDNGCAANRIQTNNRASDKFPRCWAGKPRLTWACLRNKL